MNKIRLKVIAPNRTVFDDEVEIVVARTIEGDMGIMYNHEPLLAPLSVGELRLINQGDDKIFAVSSGFMKVSRDNIKIITGSCESPEEIDLERAEASKKRAEERIEKKSDEIDYKRAEFSLKRAITRIRVAQIKK